VQSRDRGHSAPDRPTEVAVAERLSRREVQENLVVAVARLARREDLVQAGLYLGENKEDLAPPGGLC
jgi:hypothetical protein